MRSPRAAFIDNAVAARKRGEQLDGTPDTRFAGVRFDHIPTGELRLLLKLAVAQNYANAPHAKAYRAELERRTAESK